MPVMQVDVVDTFSSWNDARAVAPTVAERLNRDPALLLAAAANPILALRRLGYEIAPGFVEEFSDRLRFGIRGAARIRQLRKEIFTQVGHEFDLQSPVALERVLRDRLGLPAVPPGAPTLPTRRPFTDPLESVRAQHPVMAAILEYRQLDARAPALAPPDLFADVLEGKHRLPALRLRARLHADDHADRNDRQ